MQASLFEGIPSVAAELGLDDDAARFRMKLEQALPDALAGQRREFANLFMADIGACRDAADIVGFFATAIRRRRVVRADLAGSGDGLLLDPLAMVRTPGRWMLVARVAGECLVVALADASRYQTTGARFERPVDFDLEAIWRNRS